MRKTSRRISLSILLSLVGLSLWAWTGTSSESSVKAEAVAIAASGPQPVDDDMHHFMEYVFEPNYKRLKAGMADAPNDNQAWKAIKGDALTLAECTNLLLLRLPEENASQWSRLSVAVRTHGGELYQAARKSNYVAAREAYVTMIDNCNACHQKFADGEHQLQP